MEPTTADLDVAFHVDQLWFSAPGGIGTYVRELLCTMPDRDPSLRLLPFRARWSGAAEAAPGAEGATGLGLPIAALYPAWDLTGLPRLPRPLREAAIVHATNPAAIPPTARGQRLVVTVHDLAFLREPEAFPPRWRRLYRLGLRRAVKHADAIITPSHATAADLLARTGAHPERIHVTPLGVRLTAADGAASRPTLTSLAALGVTPPFILCVGTIEPRKNLVRLVRAHRRLAADGLPHALVLAGPDGWGTEELDTELARDAAPGAPEGRGRVVRTGALEPGVLDAAYRSADVVVYPSLSEGFGLPVAEAMARGVPVVTSNVSSLPEVAGDAALLVDPESEDSLVDAIRTVLTDHAVAADLRRRGPERAARFTWEVCADATLAVYRSLLAPAEGNDDTAGGAR